MNRSLLSCFWKAHPATLTRLRRARDGAPYRLLALAILSMSALLSSDAAAAEAPGSADAARGLSEGGKISPESPLIDGHNDVPWQYRKRSNDFNAIDLRVDTSSLRPPMATDIP